MQSIAIRVINVRIFINITEVLFMHDAAVPGILLAPLQVPEQNRYYGK